MRECADGKIARGGDWSPCSVGEVARGAVFHTANRGIHPTGGRDVAAEGDRVAGDIRGRAGGDRCGSHGSAGGVCSGGSRASTIHRADLDIVAGSVCETCDHERTGGRRRAPGGKAGTAVCGEFVVCDGIATVAGRRAESDGELLVTSCDATDRGSTGRGAGRSGDI